MKQVDKYLDKVSQNLDELGIKRGSEVVLGLSGGVDSSVSALILKELGYSVRTVFIHCWKGKGESCVADEDEKDAVKVATQLKIPIEIIDLTKEYDEYVMNYFWSEYKKGRVPNADILCNTYIKFGFFADYAFKNGADYISTGHYVQVKKFDDDAVFLASAVDDKKDQSYFLYQVKKSVLEKSVFALGVLKKSEAREIAREYGLHNADKEDSTGICFIGNINIKHFLSEKLQKKKGDVVNLDGEVIGEHIGCNFYTVGQRHGFKVYEYTPVPLYVVDKDCSKNIIVVGKRVDAIQNEFLIYDSESEVKNNIELVKNMNVFNGNFYVRIRNLGKFEPSSVENIDSSSLNISGNCSLNDSGSNLLLIKSKTKGFFGVTPGQHGVIYTKFNNDYIVLGGGIITCVNTKYMKRFEL